MTDTILPPMGPTASSVLSSPPPPPPPPPPAIEVRERTISNRTSILEITYDGSQPPHELFAALRALGWQDAVATTPRADVIDWGVPDPVRGTRYSVRPHVAVVHATLRADEARCREVLHRTRDLLAGHGLVAVDTVDTVDRGDTGEGSGVGAAGRAGPTGAAAATPGPDRVVLVDVLCPHPSAPGVEDAAASFGEVVEREDVTEVVTSTFRGNATEVVLPLRRVRLRVPADRHDELVSLVSTLGARRVAVAG